MRNLGTPTLALALVLAGLGAANASPRASVQGTRPAEATVADKGAAEGPAVTGSLARPSVLSVGETWSESHRGPGLPSPTNPLGYTGE